MSALVGGGISQVNRFEQNPSLGYQKSLVGGWGQVGESLYGEEGGCGGLGFPCMMRGGHGTVKEGGLPPPL